MAASTPPSTDQAVEEVLAMLRARGGRVTTARRRLLEALFVAPPHCTAEDLAAAVQLKAPDINISTIYRNLEELERVGVIAHTHLGHGAATYHVLSSPHGHLVCENCSATIEAPERLFRSLSKAAQSEFGFSIEPGHFAILGRCRACSD